MPLAENAGDRGLRAAEPEADFPLSEPFSSPSEYEVSLVASEVSIWCTDRHILTS
jgi:hypothetical protein